MGVTVLDVGGGSDSVGIYGHCGKDGSGVALLIVNMGSSSASLTLPTHSSRTEYALTADGLNSKKTRLNGKELKMSSGNLPALDGRHLPSGSTTVPGFGVLFTVLAGTKVGQSTCHEGPAPTPPPTP